MDVGLETLTFSKTVKLAVVELCFRTGDGGGNDFAGFLGASERNIELGRPKLLVLVALA